MATRIEAFTVPTPAGIARSAPQQTALSFNDATVQSVEILVPPGPSGLVGFQLAHSGQAIIPNNPDEWIVSNDELIKWPLEDFPGRTGWELWTYNDDVYSHTLYVRFLVSDNTGFVPVVITPIPINPPSPAELEPPPDFDLE